MTVTSNSGANAPGTDVAPVTDLITVTIDGVTLQVPKGTLVIRAAEQLGIEVPRFCDHPLLEPVAACRACLIEVEGMPKPQPACAQTLNDGMVVRTQQSSDVARLAQEGVMEFLLLNHPLDCPVCDKGGECPLQNQAMSIGRPDSRFDEDKRTFDKPVSISAQILLDRERCVSCARCTRFAEQIAGDPFIELLERGAHQIVGTAPDVPFDSYFSGNTVQICPVGALTSASYRFKSRPFDLVSTPTTCEHCASGCSLRTDYRRGVVTRRLAWENSDVNEDWNCDKGRFAFPYLTEGRITTPMVRENGELRPASWPEALTVAARGLAAAQGKVGVLVGGRVTMEDAYAYARFARVALGSDNIDFRARVSSDEEAQFLSAVVAGSPVSVSYDNLETAPIVLLAGFEPEDESPIVFLRLRKASRRGTRVMSISSVATSGLAKVKGRLIGTRPGDEARTLATLPDDIRALLAKPGAIVMLGERLAGVPGALTAAVQLAHLRGAQVIAQADSSKHATLNTIGAKHTLARDKDVVQALGKDSVAVVLDLVGGPAWPALLDVLQRGGRYATAGAIAGPAVTLDLRTLYLKDLQLLGCTWQDETVFDQLLAYVARGQLQPLLARTYDLRDIALAQADFVAKRFVGKIALAIP